MSNKIVDKKIIGMDTMDGAGVRLKRIFGYDQLNEFDPFLLLDHFESENKDDFKRGFPFHPHRGIETITYLKKGSIEHQDKQGHKEVVKAGEIQWMTAGKGIYHQEMPQESEGINGFQLWLNLPSKRKMINPEYYTFKDLPFFESEDYKVTVLSGHYHGHTGPASEISTLKVLYFDIEFRRSSTWKFTMPEGLDCFIYVYNKLVKVGDDTISKGEVALLSHGDHVEIESQSSESSFLFIAGEPIKEPVKWWGPVVMNTEEELKQVRTELEKGTFPD